MQRDGLLAMMVDASDQEIAGGHEGWVRAPEEYSSMAAGLVTDGFAEFQDGWFRPTEAGRQRIAPGRAQ